MTGQILLDWSALAISIFNMILSLWLGLTVLFNADKRSWGVILAVSGLLASSAFFFGHSLVLGQGAGALLRDIHFWWRAIWLPLVAAPYIWYLLMLWYSGFWDDLQSSLHRRQRPWLSLSLAYTFLLAGYLVIANSLPGVPQDAYPQPGYIQSSGSIPWIILLYPPYILLCIGLSVDSLLRPAPSGRVMGDLARRRARPWFLSASLVLLMITLIASASMVWLSQSILRQVSITETIISRSTSLGILDLVLLLLLMSVLLLLGQAVIAYEIFTGRTLPRKGFQRQWRDTVILSATISSLAAWGALHPYPLIFVVLVVLALVAFSYAYFSWQSFIEREHSIRQLRPFANSQNLLDVFLKPSAPSLPGDVFSGPFTALCRDVLAAGKAALVPQGDLATLGGAAIGYPAGTAPGPSSQEALSHLFTSPQSVGFPLDPSRYDGYIWVSPLWSERGLIGLLFLGEKIDRGFYSSEEIEIARAAGERLVDIQALTSLARQLALLQRQRLAESQIMDQQTRRILHDDVLPRLHAALLDLDGNDLSEKGRSDEVMATIASIHRQISDLLRELPRVTAPEVARLGLFGALQECVRGELAGFFDAVNWNVPDEVEQHTRKIQPLRAEVVFFAAREALRNVARHARPAGELVVNIRANWQDGLTIVIEDNGVRVRVNNTPITPALSQGEMVGVKDSGQGLVLHSTMMAVIGGSLALENTPGISTRVTLRLPEREAWDSAPR